MNVGDIVLYTGGYRVTQKGRMNKQGVVTKKSPVYDAVFVLWSDGIESQHYLHNLTVITKKIKFQWL